MAIITNMKLNKFVCLDKDLTVIATFDSQQIVEDKRKEKENDAEGKVEEITESPKIYNTISIF